METNNINFEADNAALQPRLTKKCPRCNSLDTKFCYYNNYSLNQPRHYCKTCRRYWTQGGICRNIPIGGSSYRRNTRGRAARPRAPLGPNVPTFARRRRPTNAGSITISGGRGRGRVIPSMGVNFPNEYEFRVPDSGHSTSSFGPMPLLSFNNNVVNVNNNVAPGFGTFLPPPQSPPRIGSGAWQHESLLMSINPNENTFLWEFDGGSGSGTTDIDTINDQWLGDLPEYTPSPQPPLPPST